MLLAVVGSLAFEENGFDDLPEDDDDGDGGLMIFASRELADVSSVSTADDEEEAVVTA